MASTTSHHHDASDDHDDASAQTISALDRLAATVADERARGSALFLIGTPSPSRATMEIPPDDPRKNGKRPDQAGKRCDDDE